MIVYEILELFLKKSTYVTYASLLYNLRNFPQHDGLYHMPFKPDIEGLNALSTKHRRIICLISQT